MLSNVDLFFFESASRCAADKFWKTVRLAIPNSRHGNFRATDDVDNSAATAEQRPTSVGGKSVTSATGLLSS
jgi:hypothetical protein